MDFIEQQLTQFEVDTDDPERVKWFVNRELLPFLRAALKTVNNLARPVYTVTASSRIPDDQTGIYLANGASQLAIALPKADQHQGVITVKVIDSGGFGFQLLRGVAGDLVDGATSVTHTVQYEYVSVVSDGVSNWYIVSET